MARPSHSQAPEPFPVFHDDFMMPQPTPMISHAPMPSAPNPVRQPLQNANANVILNPPAAAAANQSPFKSNARPSSSPLAPLKVSRGNSLNKVPMMPPSLAPPCTDSLEKREPVMSRFKTVAKKPQPELNVQLMGKENAHPPIFPAPQSQPPQFKIDLENFFQKPSGKRVLLEAAPIKELRPAKKQKLDDALLPSHDSYAPILDDGAKPNHSYATLIAMAIVRSPQRRLTLSQIYKWITDTYEYYRSKEDAGWQNSIRHNLSLNKYFVKQERPKDDPGKGNYWVIEPGAEQSLLKEKPTRKSEVPTAENMPVMSTRLEPSQPQPHPQPPRMPEPLLPHQLALPQSLLPALPPHSSQHLAPAPALPEISSDATIPASDAATIDEGVDRPSEKDEICEAEIYSPLAAAMHSSPPIPRRMEAHRNGIPSSPLRLQPSSATKSRHRRGRFMSMDDSGYISSLESSAMRPHQHGKLLTSEADRPRTKRGPRAEEEIARLRASSYDSPSKGRSYGQALPSSSPIRQTSQAGGAGQMLPPLTPAMKLKAPPKPPPSVSPSTNLRLHRQNMQLLVDSPVRRLDALLPAADNAVLQQTPGFDADGLWYDLHQTGGNTGATFDIYEDAADFNSLFALTPTAQSLGSPVKRSSVRKTRLERSQSTSALNNITNTAQLSACKAVSFLKVPQQMPNLLLETPSKVFDGLPSSPSKVFVDLQSPCKGTMPLLGNCNTVGDENLSGFYSVSLLDASYDTPDFLNEENDFPGFDMLAGFEKIGASSSSNNNNNNNNNNGGGGNGNGSSNNNNVVTTVPRAQQQQGALSRSYSNAF